MYLIYIFVYIYYSSKFSKIGFDNIVFVDMCRDSKKKHPTILRKGRLSERRNTGYSHESTSKSNAGEASFFRATEVSLVGRREESQSMIPKVCNCYCNSFYQYRGNV